MGGRNLEDDDFTEFDEAFLAVSNQLVRAVWLSVSVRYREDYRSVSRLSGSTNREREPYSETLIGAAIPDSLAVKLREAP